MSELRRRIGDSLMAHMPDRPKEIAEARRNRGSDPRAERPSPKRDAMTMLNLQEIHDFAVELAKNAGAVIMSASDTRLSSTMSTASEKKNCTLLGGED